MELLFYGLGSVFVTCHEGVVNKAWLLVTRIVFSFCTYLRVCFKARFFFKLINSFGMWDWLNEGML